MHVQQKQVLESFVRVRAFLDAHPATGTLRYDGAQETLDEVMERFREHAGARQSGRDLSRAELRRQKQLITRLRNRHMRPIVTIARAQIEPNSDPRLPEALRMPPSAIGVTKALQECDAMLAASKQFESVFVANGLPADFVAQFRNARDELESILGARATMIGTHVGARHGLKMQLRRGRRAVDRLDAVVRVTFEDDEMVLAAGRSAKRVHRVPGCHGAPVPADAGASDMVPPLARGIQLAA